MRLLSTNNVKKLRIRINKREMDIFGASVTATVQKPIVRLFSFEQCSYLPRSYVALTDGQREAVRLALVYKRLL